MEKIRRTLAFWSALVAVAALSTGCPGDGPGPEPTIDPVYYTLTGTVADMSSDREYMLKVVSYADDDDPGVVLASAPISSSGSFSVNVPCDVAPRYLMPYNESSDWTYGLPHAGVTVSNGNARFSATSLEVYAGDSYAGDVSYGMTGEDVHVEGFFFYADADCDISGGYYHTGIGAKITYAISAKTGWNWAFGTEKDGAEGTEMILASEKPSDIRFYFERY